MPPPHPRVVKAFHAMRDLGITEEKVKPVLKRLLKLYKLNWDPIEENDYRILIDAIFESEEPQAQISSKKVDKAEAPISSRKRENFEQKRTLEREELLQDETVPPLKRLRAKFQEQVSYVDKGPDYSPLAVIDPEISNEEGGKGLLQIENGAGPSDTIKKNDGARSFSGNPGKNTEHSTSSDNSTSQLLVASTPGDEAKIFLEVASTIAGFRMPSADAVVKLVEDRCLGSFKIEDPNFSVKKLLEDVCECFLELGSQAS